MSPALVEYMAANVYLCENGLLCIIVNMSPALVEYA